MILKNVRLRKLVALEGDLFLGCMNKGYFKDIVYSISIETGLYSFWKYDGCSLTLMDSALSKNNASFKLLVLMNKGEKVC